MAVNIVAIAGNLTRDGELRQMQDGTAILSFGVAVNERRKNGQTGQWEDAPVFVDCTVWGNRASAIAPYMLKGTKVAVQGKLRYSTWQDRQTGQNRSKLDVTVREIEFMSAKSGAQSQQQQAQAYQPQQGYQQPPAPAYADADIPF